MNTTQGDPAQDPNVDAQAFHREQAFQHLLNVFEGKVDATVVRHVLSDSQWKVEDAMNTLHNLTKHFDEGMVVAEPVKSTAALEHAQYVHSAMRSNTQHHHLSLKLVSKIPLTDDTGTLPVLSPKTPFVGKLEYPPFTSGMVQDSNMVQAMEALQMYAQQPAAQMPPTPDVYILQHSQIAGGGCDGQAVSPHAQPPHPLAMSSQNRMPVSSPLMPVTSPMMPVSSPDSYLCAEPTYSTQMQCALLHSPDGTGIPQAQFSGSYTMDKNASFYPSADPFRATQNLYDVQHSGGNVSAGWFAPVSESSEVQFAAVSNAEQTKTVDVNQSMLAETTDVSKAARPSKKVFRTKAYSLNPEEREALENLIEDVIIGGVDNEVMTSDESDSDSDDEAGVKAQSESKEDNGSKDNTGSDGLPKVYPAQLKVAVKHMKNLPPRFLKKIHAAPKTAGGDGIDVMFDAKRLEEREELRMVAEREKNSKMEGQKRDIKKKIRNMLDGLDSYVEEHVVLVDEVCSKVNDSTDMTGSEPCQEVPVSAPTPVTDSEGAGGWKVPAGGSSPMLGTPAQRIVLKPNVINCSDLERELLGELHAEKKSTFSIDAPEFVPRAFTPVSQPPPSCAPLAQGVCAPVTTSPYRGSIPGHNSPLLFGSQMHLTRAPMNSSILHNTPAATYMIPKVTYPMSTPATVVGMQFQQYSTPTYNALPHFNPVLQPPLMPPGFGIQDLATSRSRQGTYPLYVAPQGKPLNPYISHLSPHSSPKAVRRVIDPNIMRSMGMQPILIPHPMPHLSPNSNTRPGDPGYNPSAGNVYRHHSPQSSPKGRRRGVMDGEGTSMAGLKHKIHSMITSGRKVMVILRGLPGSGKSTLARELQGNGVVLSTDNFFMNNGKYEIDHTKLSEAHEWNRQKVVEAVEASVNPVIIDNTNTRSWEMRPYVNLAMKYSYHVEFMEPPTQWRYKLSELAEKNKHYVTVENLRRMLDTYEYTVTVESILRPAAKSNVAMPAAKDEPDLDPPLSDEATDTAQGKKPVRRRKRKRRKRKRKTAEEDKANEGESSDEDSAGEADEVVEAEEGSASAALHKSGGTEGNDKQGNLQCPPCRRQGGHITSLATLARAQWERQWQVEIGDGVLAEQGHIADTCQYTTPHTSGDVVSEAHVPLFGSSTDTNVMHAFSLIDDTDSLLKACSEILSQNVAVAAALELDENGNNAQGCSGLIEKISKTKCESAEEMETQKEDKTGQLDGFMDENVKPPQQQMFNKESKKKSETLMNDNNVQPGMLVSDDKMKVDVLASDMIMKSEQHTLGSDSQNRVEGLVDDNMMQVEKHMSNSDYRKKVTFSLESLQDLSIASIQDHKPPDRQLASDDCCVVPEREREMLSSQSNVLDDEVVSGALDVGGDDEVAEITANSSFSSLSESQGLMETNRALPDSCQDTVSQVCNGLESNFEMSQDSCCVAKTDDEKWTERCERSEVTHSEPAVTDRAGPRQRRGQHPEEKMKILMAVDELDLGDLTSWKSLTEVVSAPVTPVSKGHPRFHRFTSCDPTSSQQPKYASLPPDDTALEEEVLMPSVSDICMKDIETYTCPEDFALLQKIMHSVSGSSNSMHGQHVLCCNPRVISDNFAPLKPSVNHCTDTVMLDKGCMTDDLLVASSADGVEYLHSCFPEMSLQDLSYMLRMCVGNIEWAANILIDTGHEYRVDTPNEGDVAMTPNNIEKSTDFVKGAEDDECQPRLPASSNCARLPSDDELVPSLFCLCYLRLAPNILNSLQERILDSDMARLLAVKHFKEARLKIVSHARSDSKFEAVRSGDQDVQNQCVRSAQEINAQADRQVDGSLIDGSLVLQLNEVLAAQLIQLFGTIDDDMSKEEALSVRLDMETARRLHELWTDSVAHRKTALPQQTLLSDEELARRMQEEEDRAAPSSPQKLPTLPQTQTGSYSMSVQDLDQVVLERVEERRAWEGGEVVRKPDSPPISFKEILENEEALYLSRKEHEAQQSAASHEKAISTKLKRQKLLEMFPYVDPSVVVDIFKSSGYRLEMTCDIIQELFSPPDSLAVDPSSVTLGSDYPEEQLLTWLDELDSQSTSKFDHGKYSDEDFRLDAVMHNRLRLDCFEKARDAYRRRMMGVAAFYSQQGHAYTQKIKAANEAAAQKILQHRNPRLSQTRCVDLHGLHVDEAIRTLKQLLADKERELHYQRDKRKRHLMVVTGKGNHSHGGVARIRCAVIDYLKTNKYRYTELHVGLIKIHLKYRDIE